MFLASHFQNWRLCCIYISHISLTVSQTWLLFQHGVLLLATYLPRSKRSQAICRTKGNAVFSLFWQQLGQTKWPHYMLVSATPTISVFPARQMSQLPIRLHGWGHWNPKLHDQQGGCTPFQLPLMGDTPLKFLPYSIFKAKEKPSTF